jgi:RNA recognition motif-containing protein
VCGKQITEEQFRESFGVYGTIEEVWILKDRVTNDPKGVTYIKFSKTSEAALAMEEMNAKCIPGSPRPLKVLIAHSRDQGSRRDMNEDERLVRLFVVVNKTMSETELREHFEQFGDIDYVSIVRDRSSKESKGFAYVKYHRMSHAAKAFEECDRSFKPVFADPKPQKSSYHDGAGSGGGGGGGGGGSERFGGPGSTASGSTSASISASYDMLSYMDTSQSNPEGIHRLSVSVSPSVNQDQLWRLFDLVPGLDYCDRSRDSRNGSGGGGGGSRTKGFYTVVYNNPQSATYAKEKLHGFEYPPGHRMVVRFDTTYDQGSNSSGGGSGSHHFNRGGYPQQPGFSPVSPRHGPMGHPPPVPHQGGMAPPLPPPVSLQGPPPKMNIQNDLAHLTETIANATALLQAAGYAAPNAPLSVPSLNIVGQPMQPPAVSTIPGGETYDPSYCSVKLPSPQPLAAMDSVVSERLFIVCTPIPPQLYALKDVFGRFGSLIDIYMLNGKTCGYAKYGSKESADRAVTALHGQEICGSRLKVMPADPQDKSGDSARKRPKLATATEAEAM